jgi:phosphopantothenate-cysteine ligase
MNSNERFHTSVPLVETALDRSIPTPQPAEDSDEDTYFRNNAEPPYLRGLQKQIESFVHLHSGKTKIALVTSGGTTVPLENNTVRFIDNFSAGTRGATSTEYLLEQGYAVIFLHRQFSLLPYSRHYSHSTNCFLDYMEESTDGKVVVGSKYQTEMLEVLKKYKQARANNLLLLVPFTTVNQYLFTLRMLSEELSKPEAHNSNTLFYLAAAVSDFFLPMSRISEHKIQSKAGGGKLIVDLDPVPKFLKRLVDTWIPGAMIVSFKLETDSSILIDKAKQALERYSHQLVIGNLLQARKTEVLFVTADSVEEVKLSSEQVAAGVEIEALIIPKVVEMHNSWIHKTKS